MNIHSPRTRFNRSVLVITAILTVLFIAMFIVGMFCLLSGTVPSAGFVSHKVVEGFIRYCANRGLSNAAVCAAIFVYAFRVHSIDDLICQTGAYEIRWLGLAFIGIWAANLILRFFIPNMMMPPHGLVFLGVVCFLIHIPIKLLANKVDMYLNLNGTNRRIGDMTPLQFFDFLGYLFKSQERE